MKQEVEKVSWVRDATPWSPETDFIAGNLLREIARKNREIARQDQIIKDLTKRLLEK